MKTSRNTAFLCASMTAICAGLAGGAHAQDGDARDEIVVTGVRASLEQANELKRAAPNIIDAIVAEDVGKLPDRNVAEALQRVTGIQIDRSFGEGSTVSIRGIGDTLNRTEINGVSFGNTALTRGADLRNIPAEFIGRVEVAKSPTADMVEGGVGGTVSITTRRPFDGGGGFRSTISAQAVYSPITDTRDTSAINPELFGYVSNTFNDVFGASFMVHYINRATRGDLVDTLSWIRNASDDQFDSSVLPPAGVGEDLFFPRLIRYVSFRREEERLALAGSFQYKPTDAFNANVDVTFNSRDITLVNDLFQFNTTGATVDPDSVVAGGPGGDVAVFAQVNDLQLATLETSADNNARSASIVGNFEWLADQWEVDGVFGFSKGEFEQFQGSNVIPLATVSSTFDYRNPDALPTVSLDPAVTFDPTIYDGLLANRILDDIDQENLTFRLNAQYNTDFAILSSIKVGGFYRDQEFVNKAFFSTFAAAGDGLNDFFGSPDATALFFQTITRPSGINDFFRSQSIAGIPDEWGVPDQDAALRVLLPDAVTEEQLRNFPNFRNTADLAEETFGGYAMANFAGNAGIDFSGNVGVRIVSTDVTVNGFAVGDTTVPVTFDNDYTKVLPSGNIKFNLDGDQLTLRLAGARVLARPEVGDLIPRTTFNQTTLTGVSGNPELDPFLATQFEGILSWFPASDTAITIGGFWKDVASFVTRDVELVDLFNDGRIFEINRPVSDNEGATIKGIEFSYQQGFSFLPGPLQHTGLVANYTYADGSSSQVSTETGAAIGFPGLSKHTVNVIAYYEDDRISFRTAYSFRDEFLADAVGFGGGGPVFNEARNQIDASLSYKVTDRVTVFMEGVNLANANEVLVNEDRFRLNGRTLTGRRGFFGARLDL